MLLVAHRTPGSRRACERLAAAGARVFEADVQVADDDRVVVSHYLPLRRFAHLQRDNWRLRWHTSGRRDPGLRDVAALVPAGCRVLLDVKEKAPERRARLRAALRSAQLAGDRFCVCAPHADDLAELRAAGLGTWRTVGNGRELLAVLDAGPLADEAVTVRHTLLTAEAVERLHAVVPKVIAWTVNDRRRAGRLRALGVDGITTDSVTVLRAMNTDFH